jgi:hypothetical protein
MDEIEAKLAELESEFEQGANDPEQDDDNPDIEDAAPDGESEGEQDDGADSGEDKPKGYLSYEEYVAAGNDPAYYKGPKAFEQEYERIQELKEQKKAIRELTEMSKGTLEAVEQWKVDKEAQMRSELEARLAEQKETADVDGALETQKQLDELNKQPVQKREPHPVIKEFIQSNPILDEGSESFNAEFFDDMSAIQAGFVNDLSGNGAKELTEAQLRRCMSIAFDRAKELHPEIEKSPRNDRKGATRQPKQAPKAQKKDISTAIKDFKIEAKNPELNSGAPAEIFEMLKEKHGAEAAEKFAKRLGVGQ